MDRIVSIDKNTRIKIIPDNFILQRAQKSKLKKTISWKSEGYFQTIESIANYYLNSFPYRDMKGTRDFRELIRAVKTAQEKILSLINKIIL